MREYLQMPLMWLDAHCQVMVELQAEESFREAEVLSVGGGRLTKSAHDKVVRKWSKALGREGEKNVSRAKLESLGVKVRTDESR